MWCWWNGVLSGEIAYYVNPYHSFLVEKTIQKRQGILSSNGSLIIEHQDKTFTTKENYVLVRDEKSEPLLDWSKNIRVIDAEKFFNLKTEVLKRIHLIKPELFILENEILINSGSVVGLNLVTTSPATALFLKLILKEKTDLPVLESFIIYHDPEFELDSYRFNIDSSGVVAINFTTREILIVGNNCLEDIKEFIVVLSNMILSRFGSILLSGKMCFYKNEKLSFYLIPSSGGGVQVLNDPDFTTNLSDQFCVGETGFFSIFKGACIKNSEIFSFQKKEIFEKCHQFGNLMENIVYDSKTRIPSFEIETSFRNGFITFSTEDVFNRKDIPGIFPENIFLFIEDDLGFIPFLGLLDDPQALDIFLPFFLNNTLLFSHPRVSIDLLRHFLTLHSIKLWIINIGFLKKSHLDDKKNDLSVLNKYLKMVITKDLKHIKLIKDTVFFISVPEFLNNIDLEISMPRKLWTQDIDYDLAANRFKESLIQNHQRSDRSISHAL
jgi:phosphoenolpyruvate carboxykinase (ATP)